MENCCISENSSDCRSEVSQTRITSCDLKAAQLLGQAQQCQGFHRAAQAAQGEGKRGRLSQKCPGTSSSKNGWAGSRNLLFTCGVRKYFKLTFVTSTIISGYQGVVILSKIV